MTRRDVDAAMDHFAIGKKSIGIHYRPVPIELEMPEIAGDFVEHSQLEMIGTFIIAPIEIGG